MFTVQFVKKLRKAMDIMHGHICQMNLPGAFKFINTPFFTIIVLCILTVIYNIYTGK